MLKYEYINKDWIVSLVAADAVEHLELEESRASFSRVATVLNVHVSSQCCAKRKRV